MAEPITTTAAAATTAASATAATSATGRLLQQVPQLSLPLRQQAKLP